MVSSRVALGLTLLLIAASGITLERFRKAAPPPVTPAVHGALASELEAGADSVEGLSQTALEERLDQLEQALSAGSSGFPRSEPRAAPPDGPGFGLD